MLMTMTVIMPSTFCTSQTLLDDPTGTSFGAYRHMSYDLVRFKHTEAFRV